MSDPSEQLGDSLQGDLKQTHLHPIKVLIVDDDPDLLELISPMIERVQFVERVVTAHGVAQAKEKLSSFLIDVILSDIAMPKEDGISLISYAHARTPRIPSIAFTALGGGPILARALHAGAQGFLLKTAQPWEYEAAINAAANGATYISSALLGELQRFLRTPPNPPVELTETEQTVANLIKEGMTNQQIAKACELSLSTVKKYVSSLLRKMDCPSRSALTARLVEADFWDQTVLRPGGRH